MNSEIQAHLTKRPHQADTTQLIIACLLLAAIHIKNANWSDWTCGGVATINIVYYIYQDYHYRKWKSKMSDLCAMEFFR